MSAMSSKDQLSFFEHLEELRWHIIRSLVAIMLFAIAAFLGKSFIFDRVIFGPTHLSFPSYKALCWMGNTLHLGKNMCVESINFKIINLDMAGQFTTHIKVSFIAGLIVASPYVFWELWRFLKPALYSNEKKAAKGLVAVCAGLFLFGILFGYFLIVPFSVNFLGNYHVSPDVQNTINLGSYISVISMICLSAGIIFELPILAYFLSKIGLLTPDFMKSYRKHAIVVILILAAVITPPDVTSQVLIAVPILLLYEVSIKVSANVIKKAEAEQ